MKILLVEDEARLSSVVKEGLEEHDHWVDIASNGKLGLVKADSKAYDFIILDLMLPEMDGIQLCQNIRITQPEVPILMLTALGTLQDKLAGFDAGADDYLVKPFEFEELLARIKSLSRRKMAADANRILRVADLELNLDRKIALREGKSIELTAKEFALLELLMRNKNRVLSRNDIAKAIWGMEFDSGTNTVEVYINFIRRKIDKDFATKLIHTQVGLGYVIRD